MTTPGPPDISDEARRRGMVAAIAGVSVFAACLGHSLPFFAVKLASLGASNTFIGLNVALSAVAGLALTPFLPDLIARYGIRKVLAAGFVVIFAGYGAAFVSGENFFLWHLARLLIGAGGTAFFVASEIWINLVARPERRGAAMGLYGTFLAAGFALGPLTLEITGYAGVAPFVAGASFLILAAPWIFSATPPAFDAEERSISVLVVTRKAPVVFLAMAVFALSEAALLSLAPVYGLRIGLGEVAAGRMVLAYALGPLFFQYLIGRAVDRFSPKTMLAACGLAGVIGALALPAAAQSQWTLYPLVFVWGGAVIGIGTCVLAYVGANFTGKELAAANAGIALAYNAGALAGPALSGSVMDLAGPNALSATLATAFMMLILFLAISRRAKAP